MLTRKIAIALLMMTTSPVLADPNYEDREAAQAAQRKPASASQKKTAPQGPPAPSQQAESGYDDARMRPRDDETQAKGSGRSVPYDGSRMEPGEVSRTAE
jgi:hypothetical protein